MNFNPFSLEGKVIIITGASSGIGAQCAIDCSKMGAKVVLIARNQERLQEVFALLDNQDRHKIYSLDLCDYDLVGSIVKEIVATMGEISGVLSCAGISSVTPLKFISEEDLDTFFSTNVYTAINLTKEVCQVGNYDKKGCSIVLFSSVMGSVGESGKTLYSLTKGALASAARSLACELAYKKIRVNTISPGLIITPINEKLPHITNPEKRKIFEDKHLLGLGNVEDVSMACIYLLSEASRWVTGINLHVDGGYTAK